ncbi:hypothetical protein [Undibacterium sp.]|uniref:hypothetical protein n=1 Tax=Undibacterium sp. TaxID=1914977 RepID=UPI0037525963
MKTLRLMRLLFLISTLMLFGYSIAAPNVITEVSLEAADTQCTPINMINTASQKPCGDGYSGLMFKRTIVTCPDGRVTQSPEYDRSQCVPNTGNGGYVNPCIANPALCMGKPKVLGCPPGKHWTMEGLPYAHCVSDDPVCNWGESLKKDAIGEPIGCFPNTCPSNQVLQADGISCACPVGTSWNGTMCVPPIVTCPADSTSVSACPAGQTGQITTTTTYAVVNGACVPSTSSSNNCQVITCPADSTSVTACPAGQTGQITTTTSYSVVNGACAPSTSSSNNCQVITCPANSTSVSACPAGQTGQITTTTSYSVVNGACTPSTSSSNNCQALTCPANTTSFSACPAGQTGQIATTTFYVIENNSCTPYTSVLNTCIVNVPNKSCTGKSGYNTTTTSYSDPFTYVLNATADGTPGGKEGDSTSVSTMTLNTRTFESNPSGVYKTWATHALSCTGDGNDGFGAGWQIKSSYVCSYYWDVNTSGWYDESNAICSTINF